MGDRLDSSEGTWLPQDFIKVCQEMGKTSPDKPALLCDLTLLLPFSFLRLPLKEKYEELFVEVFQVHIFLVSLIRGQMGRYIRNILKNINLVAKEL